MADPWGGRTTADCCQDKQWIEWGEECTISRTPGNQSNHCQDPETEGEHKSRPEIHLEFKPLALLADVSRSGESTYRYWNDGESTKVDHPNLISYISS